MLSRSRSVTPAESGAYSSPSPYEIRAAAAVSAAAVAAAASSDNFSASYNYVNMTSSRPPKILESPLDSKSLLSGKIRDFQDETEHQFSICFISLQI